MSMPKTVTVLGATGSIGASTLDVVRSNPGEYQVKVLTARSKGEALANLALEFKPDIVAIEQESAYAALKARLEGTDIRIEAGPQAVIEAAKKHSDVTVAGIVGAAGLAPTLAAVRRGGVIALANKECLVCAGPRFLEEAQRHDATVLPVDSEHNAIFQVLDRERPHLVEHIVLTASGGPFRNHSAEALARVTPEEAVRHPNWQMGRKISVDSATLMNKGLELIEAAYLFGIDESRIEVLIHPESMVHGLVQYRDGSLLAQLSQPDMRTPIACALAWPERAYAPVQRLDLARIGRLHFEAPDIRRFPALDLARQALRKGQEATLALNAANEVAVQAFLDKKIGFTAIAQVVAEVLEKMEKQAISKPSGATWDADVLELDAEVRRHTVELLNRHDHLITV